MYDFSHSQSPEAMTFLIFAKYTFRLIVVAAATVAFVAGCVLVLEALR